MSAITREDALEYHRLNGKPGKISVVPTKPMVTQRDLGLAYTPGVAVPVLEIEKDPELAYEYTSRGNLVAVISDGTAILGLGNRGALASKPVMEGKGVLFKRFADIDVFDIEVDTKDPDEFIKVVAAIAPTFGGINLEDIKAPECFYIENKLKEMLDIPVFHDDQHGTAIIAGAAFINALELTDRKIKDTRVVFSGAGASANACANLLIRLGLPRENVWMVDTAGLIYNGRTVKMTPEKQAFAQGDKPATLAEVLKDADMFFGLSAADIVSQDMVKSMAAKPIIFAMANPDPEIKYELAKAACPDAIVATGRSDYPNQINNVLGFPFIFRGALDVRARTINEEMKLAAAHALAKLTREPVPADVLKVYNLDHLEFGTEYVVPKPFDTRVCTWEATAVAKAAMESGVARIQIDLDTYPQKLSERLGIH
jgi:malate dehydrogenase (oxaloacetate-decarboxylating)(NADP+)